jgi:outer membrane protein TolC
MALAGLFATLPFTATATPLTLDDAVRAALANHPLLAAADADVRAAGASLDAAKAARLPSLDAHASLRRTDNALETFGDKLLTHQVNPATDFTQQALTNPDASTLFNLGIGLQFPVYTGGRLSAAVSGATDRVAAVTAQNARTADEVVFAAQRAYIEAQSADVGVQIVEDALQAARRHAATTSRLVRERRTVESDKLAAEVNAALIESHLAQARSRASQARALLIQATSLPSVATADLEAWRTPAVPADIPAIETAFAQAIAERKDLAAARAEARSQGSRVAEVRAQSRPQVSVVASQNWYDDQFDVENPAWSVAGVVSGNLWSGGRVSAETSAARALAEAAGSRSLALEDRIRAEVMSAHAELSAATLRVRLCADNEGKSRRAVELVRARYGEGRTILLDLLQAENVLVETRTEKLAAELSLRIAEARMALVTGTR